MTTISTIFESIEGYTDISELLRLRIIFALDAQQNLFDDEGNWKLGTPKKIKIMVQGDVEPKTTLLERYRQIERQQSIRIVDTDPLGLSLQYLQQLLGLNDTEICIFVTLVFTKQDRTLSSLCNEYIPHMRWITFKHCCAVLSGVELAEIDACLGAQGSLIASGLLYIDWSSISNFDEFWYCLTGLDSTLFGGISEMSVVLREYLRNISLDTALDTRKFNYLGQDAEILIHYLSSALKQKTLGCNVLIYGKSGVGKTEFVYSIVRQLEANLYETQSEGRFGKPLDPTDRIYKLQFSQRLLSRAKNNILLIDSAEDIFGKIPYEESFSGTEATKNVKKNVIDLLQGNPVPVIWVSSTVRSLDPSFLNRFDIVIKVDAPPVNQLKKIIQHECANMKIDDQSLNILSAHCDMTPALLTRMHKVNQLIQQGDSQIPSNRIALHCAKAYLEATGVQAGKLFHQSNYCLSYDVSSSSADCDLPALVRNLQNIRSARICLHGPPGTGKTAFVQHIAQELGKALKVVSASQVLSRYVGDTEKSIARLFSEADSLDMILFLDEVDSLLTDRAGTTQSWKISQVNELLYQMENFKGIMFAATNQFSILDTAVMRRFDLKIQFSWLTLSQLEKILSKSLNGIGLTLSPEGVERLNQLRCLAPGDIALVLRQSNFRPICSDIEFIDRLREEHAMKNQRHRSIGFVDV